MSKPKDDKSMQKMAVSLSGASADPHDTDPPGADETNVRAGHEPDKFDVRAILYVPAGVVVVLIVTYLIVTVVFETIRTPWTTPEATPQQIAEGQKPLNEKLNEISSRREDAKVKQPILEGMRISPSQGERPDQMIQKQQIDKGNANSFAYDPQYLRPENYYDPHTKNKPLIQSRTIDMDGVTVRQMPIDEAMKQTAKSLKVGENSVKVLPFTPVHASMTNGGQYMSQGQKEVHKKNPVNPD